jgi:hypothetical protein
MLIEPKELKVMKIRAYRIAVRLTAMSDGRERWVEDAAANFPRSAARPDGAPFGTPSGGSL